MLDFFFSHNTKYFCVRMLRKLLPDYPEDAVRRSLHYHYLKPIPAYPVTLCEIDLLNRINGHHSRWTYSRQPFSQTDELVRVSDFLPFYEHLRGGHKPTSTASNAGMHTLRQLLPQTQQSVQRSADFMNGVPSILRAQPTATPRTAAPISSYSLATELARESISTTSRPIAPVPNLSRPARPHKPIGNPYATLLPQSISIPRSTGKATMILLSLVTFDYPFSTFKQHFHGCNSTVPNIDHSSSFNINNNNIERLFFSNTNNIEHSPTSAIVNNNHIDDSIFSIFFYCTSSASKILHIVYIFFQHTTIHQIVSSALWLVTSK